MADSLTDDEPVAPGSPRGERRAFRHQVASGLAWTLIGTWGRQAIDLVVFMILARLLVPEDMGLLALAMVFILFAQLVVDQGMGDALVQRREVTAIQIDTAFWVAVATGTLLSLALLVLAGPIEAGLAQPGLAPVLRALSPLFVVAAFTTIQIALLRRALAFRSLSMRALLASAGGGAVGVALALAGAGVWALVGQQLASALFSVATLWWVTPWRPSLRASRAEVGGLFRFGIHIVGGDVITYLTRNVDNLLVGAVLGVPALGYYVVGYRILTATSAILVQVTRKMTFPIFSRLQDDPSRMRRAYLRVTRAAAAVILPGYVALAVVATELVVVLFGSRWERSGAVAAVLLLIGPVVSIQALSLALLNAVGRPDVGLRFRVITTAVTVTAFVIAVDFGIVAMAAAFVIPGYLLLPLNLWWVQRHAGIDIGRYLANMRGVAFATAIMAAVMLGLRALTGDATPGVVLAVLLPAAALVFGGALWFLDRELIQDLVRLAGQVPPFRRSRLRQAP